MSGANTLIPTQSHKIGSCVLIPPPSVSPTNPDLDEYFCCSAPEPIAYKSIIAQIPCTPYLRHDITPCPLHPQEFSTSPTPTSHSPLPPLQPPNAVLHHPALDTPPLGPHAIHDGKHGLGVLPHALARRVVALARGLERADDPELAEAAGQDEEVFCCFGLSWFSTFVDQGASGGGGAGVGEKYKSVDENLNGHGVNGGLAGRGGRVNFGGGGGDDFAEDGEGVGYEFVFAVCVGGGVSLGCCCCGGAGGCEFRRVVVDIGVERNAGCRISWGLRKGGLTHQILRHGLVAIHLGGLNVWLMGAG